MDYLSEIDLSALLWTFSTAVTFKYEDSPVHFTQFINTEIIIENELKKRAGRERERVLLLKVYKELTDFLHS